MTRQELIITANLVVKTSKALDNESHINGLVEVLAERLAEAQEAIDEAAVIMMGLLQTMGVKNQ
ncbi:hypothetical protein [Caudoviricetes sp.]|nr:hypothetical protein [Caudoviricetes sp.]